MAARRVIALPIITVKRREAVYGIFMLLCGLAAGVVGLIAVMRKHERSWLVWLAFLPGAFVIVFILGEFLAPH